MNISNLEAYVNQKNQWAAIFKGKQLSLLNKKDRQAIADSIDCDLSPENITCDGERSASEVRKRYTFLHRVASELLSVDPTVKMYEYSE